MPSVRRAISQTVARPRHRAPARADTCPLVVTLTSSSAVPHGAPVRFWPVSSIVWRLSAPEWSE